MQFSKWYSKHLCDESYIKFWKGHFMDDFINYPFNCENDTIFDNLNLLITPKF